MKALQAYPWPGNVRELRNALAKAAIFCRRSKIEIANLPDAVCRSCHPFGRVPAVDGVNTKLRATPKRRGASGAPGCLTA